MSFVFAPAATYMVSLSRKNCNNIKNHLAMLCLIVLRSNLRVKFAKFGFKFYAPRPVLRKHKFKICSATAPNLPARSAATSHVQRGRWGFLRRCASSCKQTGEGLPLAVLKESAS